jgi:hypothetical protein
VQAAVVHDQSEIRADALVAEPRYVRADEVDRRLGRSGLGPCRIQSLRYVVDTGGFPAVLGKVDRRIAGAATEIERAACGPAYAPSRGGREAIFTPGLEREITFTFER